jgi:hypothetical protein
MVECVTAGAYLAKEQGDSEAYSLASKWLEAHDSE